MTLPQPREGATNDYSMARKGPRGVRGVRRDNDRCLGRRRGGRGSRSDAREGDGHRPEQRQAVHRAAVRWDDHHRTLCPHVGSGHLQRRPRRHPHCRRRREAGDDGLGGGPRHLGTQLLLRSDRVHARPACGELGANRSRHRNRQAAPRHLLARQGAGERAPVRGRRRGLQLHPLHWPRRRRCQPVHRSARQHGVGFDHRARRSHGGVQASGAARVVPVRPVVARDHGDVRAGGDRGGQRDRLGGSGGDRPVHADRCPGGQQPGLGAEPELLGPRREVPGESASLPGCVEGARHSGAGHPSGGIPYRPDRPRFLPARCVDPHPGRPGGAAAHQSRHAVRNLQLPQRLPVHDQRREPAPGRHSGAAGAAARDQPG